MIPDRVLQINNGCQRWFGAETLPRVQCPAVVFFHCGVLMVFVHQVLRKNILDAYFFVKLSGKIVLNQTGGCNCG